METPGDEELHDSADPNHASHNVALHHIPPRTVRRDNDDESQTSAKYRRLDWDGSRTSASSASSSRFLFVDSSSSQRPRSDQRAINAHIQQTAHRNRRQAAAQRLRGTANIGRYRREVQLQPRPTDLQHLAQRPLSPQNLPVTRASSISLDQQSLPATPSSSVSLDQDSEDLQQQLVRLRHYGAVRGPEVRQAFDEQEADDERVDLGAIRRTQDHDASADSSSVKTLLTQILQRLDAGNLGHAIHGRTGNVLKSTVLDPFGISSVQITPGMDSVLRHFEQVSDVMLPSVFPTRQQAEMQTRWAFQIAAEEPVVLYAILAISAAERTARLGELRGGSLETTFTEEDLHKRKVPDFVSYKLNTIKYANETMKSMENAAKVSTIFALMCLLSIEVITGNHEEVFAHISGLQKLIAWRGGYHGLPQHVTELILSSSYMCAAMTRTLPSAPPTSSLPNLPQSLVAEIRENVPEDLKQMGRGILNPDMDAVLDWRILQAYRDMVDVVHYREYYHERQLQPLPAELEYINTKSYQFRYAVLSVPFEPRLPTSDKEEAGRLALLIFWFCNYQIAQPDSALNRALTTQLKSALEASDLKGLWGPQLDLLTWILLLGAFISAGQRERPWFVLNLARAARVLRLKEWPDVRSRLLSYFYLDRIYLRGMRESWEEARLLADSMEAGLS